MSGLELFLQRCQTFAFFPVIEAGGLFAAVESGRPIAQMCQGLGLKLLMQQLSDDVAHFLEGETRCRFFPPAASLASGTTWRSR